MLRNPKAIQPHLIEVALSNLHSHHSLARQASGWSIKFTRAAVIAATGSDLFGTDHPVNVPMSVSAVSKPERHW